jgi:hypothetical protein
MDRAERHRSLLGVERRMRGFAGLVSSGGVAG